MLIIGHVAKHVHQASILDTVEQTGKAHPVVVSLGAELVLHLVFHTVAHDVDLTQEGKVPSGTLILALIVLGSSVHATLCEGHLTGKVGL